MQLNQQIMTNQNLLGQLEASEKRVEKEKTLTTQVNMQAELLDRQKQTIAELIRAKEQLTLINDEL